MIASVEVIFRCPGCDTVRRATISAESRNAVGFGTTQPCDSCGRPLSLRLLAEMHDGVPAAWRIFHRGVMGPELLREMERG